MIKLLAHYFEHHYRVGLEYNQYFLRALGVIIICIWITSCNPIITPVIQLPLSDEIIFTIQNSEPWSGKEGDPRPNWVGWGAETFIVAPDGSFWITDTAVDPNRLLHFSPQGELLKEISLQNMVTFPSDLVTSEDALWVLDTSSQQPKVVRLSTDGEFLSSVDIPREIMTYDGNFVSNGVFNILIGEESELLLSGINGLYELLDASGEIVARPLDALAYHNHTYRVIYDESAERHLIYVDGVPLEIDPSYVIDLEPILGINPDGRFAIAVYTQTQVEAYEYETDNLVNYYTSSGKLLGTARQRPQTFYKSFNNHLAFGPDGAIYQLVSNPDHSVQIVRLGFPAGLPVKTVTPVITPTPLTTLRPAWTVASPDATDQERAREALLAFFTGLSEGRYTEAVSHYGGSIGESLGVRAQMPGETIDAYWQYICTFLWCLPVADITDVEQVSADEYLFYVVFMLQDGNRFEIGACCGGDPAAHPPIWQFAYPVQKIDGDWKVMRGPLFTP